MIMSAYNVGFVPAPFSEFRVHVCYADRKVEYKGSLKYHLSQCSFHSAGVQRFRVTAIATPELQGETATTHTLKTFLAS